MSLRFHRCGLSGIRRQRGFSLVTAVFLIGILAALSVYMIAFRLIQDSSASLDTLGARAFAAARSGIEWGAYRSLRNNSCAGATPIALAGSLAPFTATVTCTRSTYNEAGTTISMDTIVANACNQPTGGPGGNCPNAAPSANYVERQITITVGQP